VRVDEVDAWASQGPPDCGFFGWLGPDLMSGRASPFECFVCFFVTGRFFCRDRDWPGALNDSKRLSFQGLVRLAFAFSDEQ